MKIKNLFPLLTLLLATLACDFQINLTNPPPADTPTLTAPAPDSSTATSTSTLPQAPSPTGLTPEMLRSGTYHTPAYGRTITLVDGRYSDNNSMEPYTVQMMDQYAIGDLNGDGRQDAAIILWENSGGTGLFETLIVVLDAGGAPLQADASLLGDRFQINAIEISSGVIHLDLVVHGPNDPFCCPTQPQRRSYWMIDGRLWLMQVATTIGGSEHSIRIDAPGNWAEVTNPFSISGSVPISPFENNLAYRISLSDTTLVNEASLMVSSSGMGSPGTFSQNFDLSMAGITGDVIIQFLDISPADGSTTALASVIVTVQ